MVLRGHTTIELKNVETGETRKIEEHNMITNGLKKILEYVPTETTPPITKLLSSGSDSADSSNSGHKRSMKMLTGGLLLFDSQLTEDVDNFIPPAGVSTVGCASHLAYTGTNLMAGSYNESESGKIDNGYKHVWDFGTSQANGQIACVCLTTREGGYAAAGTFPFDSNYVLSISSSKTTKVNNIDQLSIRDGFSQYLVDKNGNFGTKGILYADYNEGTMLSLADCNEWVPGFLYNPSRIGSFENSFLYKKSITLSKKRLMLKDFSIFDSNAAATSKGQTPALGYGTREVEEIVVKMPDSLSTVLDNYLSTSGYFYAMNSCDEGFIYIVIYKDMSTSNQSGIVPKDDTFHIWKINVGDFSSEHVQVRNTTTKSILAYMGSSSSSQIYVTNEYVLVIAIDGYTYLINIADATDISEVVYPDGTPFTFNVASPNVASVNNFFWFPYFIKGKIYLCKNDRPMVVDTVTKEAKYRNLLLSSAIWGGGTYILSATYVQHSNGFVLGEYYSASSNYSWYALLSTLPEILITINNLASPVLKTTAETMKITYTLTMSDE